MKLCDADFCRPHTVVVQHMGRYLYNRRIAKVLCVNDMVACIAGPSRPCNDGQQARLKPGACGLTI